MVDGARMPHVAAAGLKCMGPRLPRHYPEPCSHCPCAVEGLLYMAPACCLWLILGVAVVEWPRMAAENALGLIAAKPGLYLMAAAMGFGVNSLAYIVIQLASSLTLKARWKIIIKWVLFNTTLHPNHWAVLLWVRCRAGLAAEASASGPTSSCSLPAHLRTV